MFDTRYEVRVVLPLLAVRSDLNRGGSRFVELTAGSVIVTAEAFDKPGLLKVRKGEEELLVFARDLQERTEPLYGATGSDGEW